MSKSNIFRDPTRDTVCDVLRGMGIDAQIAECGRPEENTERGPFCESLGMIDIAEGPIRWINVIRKRLGHIREYNLKCGVPDGRLDPSSPKVQIESAPKRNFPLFGKVVDSQWKGEDSGLGLISHLSSDSLLKQKIIKSNVVMNISAHGNLGLWIISTDYSRHVSPPIWFPSEEEWQGCQSIARHLLTDWSQDDKSY